MKARVPAHRSYFSSSMKWISRVELSSDLEVSFAGKLLHAIYTSSKRKLQWKVERLISVGYSLRLTSAVGTILFQYPFLLVYMNPHALCFGEGGVTV